MEDYQKRVIKELDELQERIAKLGVFLRTVTYQNLDQEQKQLLQKQHKIMNKYANILNKRIQLF